MVQDVGLERRLNDRGQLAGEDQQAIEIRLGQGRVVPPVLIVARMQLGDPGLHEVGLLQQFGLELQQFIELRERQLAMDVERPEAAGMLGIQIVRDDLGQIGDVGPGRGGTAYAGASWQSSLSVSSQSRAASS